MAVNRIWMLNAPSGVVDVLQRAQIAYGYSGIVLAKSTTSVDSVRTEEELRIKITVGGQGMKNYTRGAAILVEAEIALHTPFGSDSYRDPATTPTCTIKDADGTVTVDAQNMTKQDTGKYYYRWQSATTSQEGIYTSEVFADDTNADGRVRKALFRLV